MKFEEEITTEVNIDYNHLLYLLKKYDFYIKEEYDLKDIYMIKKDVNINIDILSMLKDCILIRNIIEKDKNTKQITYKYKEYNDKKEIKKQGKVNCVINSIKQAKDLLTAIGYEEFININDHSVVVSNNIDEFVIQLVNDKHIYIEVENNDSNRYSNIEEMKNIFTKYNIPIKNNDFYAKKAETEIREKYYEK